MGNKRFVCLLLIVSLTVACGNGEKQLDNIPIAVSQSETQAVDVDLVIENAHNEVEKILPGAYLTFFSLVAECEDIDELQGEINLDFTQTRLNLLGKRIFIARVTVDTAQQSLRMEVRDETDYYPSIDPLVLQGIGISDIASILEAYLDSHDRCGGTIVLARTSTNSPWRVRCGPPDKVFLECLEIDSVSGEITKPR